MTRSRAVESRSFGHNDLVTDIPRRAASRTAKLAALPLGFAGRTALGLGKRVVGIAADVISAEIQQRTAEQLFSVLGQLKGGAMKFGQALSVFEAAMPEEMAGPYRAGADQAAGGRAADAGRERAQGAGRAARARDWRDRFVEFDDSPAAAASIGQVHRARVEAAAGPTNARRRRAVAVKVQYPGAGEALLADLKQLSRLAGMFRIIQPGMDIKPLLAELRDRITEELDYALEAEAQRAFAAAYADDPEIFVPRVVAVGAAGAGHRVGRRHAAGHGHQRRHRGGTRRGRPADGHPALLRARPGPGCCTPTRTRATSGILPDGRLGVIDFGAVARLPGGHPEPIGRLVRLALRRRRRRGGGRAARRGLHQAGRRDRRRGGARLPAPDARAGRGGRSSGSPGPGCAARRPGWPARARPAYQLSRKLNLPPSYLLIHRVTLGSIGVLCQLEAQGAVPARSWSGGCPASRRSPDRDWHDGRPARADAGGPVGTRRLREVGAQTTAQFASRPVAGLHGD